jgi:hypothetical protein
MPACAGKEGWDNNKKIAGKNDSEESTSPILTLKLVAWVWECEVRENFAFEISSGKVSPAVRPKELGMLADLMERIVCVAVPGGTANFRDGICDIIAHAVQNWALISDTPQPNIKHFVDIADVAMASWYKAGKPVYHAVSTSAL